VAHGTHARKREQLSQLISVVAEVLDVAHWVAHWTARVAELERALDETRLTPMVYRANLAGILMARHFPG
jgi:hypothetical protein